MMMNNGAGGRSWSRAIGIGVVVAVITAIVMLALTTAGVSPFPKPPSLAFAETLLHRSLPLPVGLLFHAAYVTFWSVIFVRYFRSAISRRHWHSQERSG